MSAPDSPISPSRLFQSLAVITVQHPTARKRLVGVDVNFGREVLQALARQTGGWVGWEAANIRGIADELAFVPLSTLGERVASDVEVAALVNQALDEAVASGEITGQFASLSRSLGFRGALRDSLLDARTGGVSPARLREVAVASNAATALAAVLERFEALLAARKLADPARVLSVAIDSFASEAPFVLDGVIVLVPSLSTRGLAGELVSLLLARGAVVLDADFPRDISPPATLLASQYGSPASGACSILAKVSGSTASDPSPLDLDRTLTTVDLFVAATPAEEIRDVLRRAMREGLRWDDVEIVTTDPDTYGIALDALSTRLGIGVTMLKGLPLARTRIGRALDRWFAWIGDGLPADILRQALEAGDIGVADSGYPSSRLASEFRALSVGWGRERYTTALARLQSGEVVAGMRQRDDETEEEFNEKRQRRASLHSTLALLLQRLFSALPAVPERGSDTPVRASVNALATAALEYLTLVTAHGQAEQQSMEKLRGRLAEIAAVAQPVVSFGSALAGLRESLGDLRAWPFLTSEVKPWSSAGGMLHLTDIQHAGTTGRKRIFVVGLDADRTRGGVLQDPVLSDRVRASVGRAMMATSTERHESAAWRTGVALAGLRGRVTLSYALSAALDGREAGPSPLLLQAMRLAESNKALSFQDMRKLLLPPACAVPAPGHGILDARDVWLGAMVDGALMLDGSTQTREAFTSLTAGLDALDRMASPTASGYHGLVPSAGPLLDPLAQGDREISPSSLETLAACPLSWFYKYGLRLRDPRDPEYDAERWLDSLQRGALLHLIYERFVADFIGRQADILDVSAEVHMHGVVERALMQSRTDVPPPSEMVYASEAAAIVRDSRLFLELEREAFRANPAVVWNRVELPFGRQFDGSASNDAGTFTIAGGQALRIQGRADRIDTMTDGSLRVVDYKTGSSSRFEKGPSAIPFAGGRQLQPALYSAAVETVTGSPVGAFEYRFPTEKGGSEIVTYEAAELAGARALVGDLLAQVTRGEFISTNDASDCRYCDYGSICRSSTTGFGKTSSPRATWGEVQGANQPLYQPMRTRRGEGAAATVVELAPSEIA